MMKQRKERIRVFTLLGALLFISSLLFFFNKEKIRIRKEKESVGTSARDTQLLSYFIDTITGKTKKATANYDQLGLGGGVNAFLLRKVYPGFIPEDFEQAEARQGYYSVNNDTLYFSGNLASDSPVLTEKGMNHVFERCSKRLDVTVQTKEDVDLLLNKLSQ